LSIFSRTSENSPASEAKAGDAVMNPDIIQPVKINTKINLHINFFSKRFGLKIQAKI
jgi:hypothetical protein